MTERQRSSMRHKVGRSLISSRWQTYWHHLEESVQDASRKIRKNWMICCKSTLTRRHLATINMMIDFSSRKSRIRISSEKSRRGQTCNRRALSKRERERKCQKTTPKETASVGSQQANVHSEKHAHSSMTPNQKGKGKERPRSLSPTGYSEGDGKGSDDWGAKDTAKLTGKSLSVKANRLLWTNLKTGSCQMSDSCSCWHVPESAKFKAPGGCKIRRQVCTQTHSKTCWWTVKFRIDCYSHSIEWWLTDVITESSVGWQDPISSETSASREQVRSHKGEIRTCSGSHPDWTSKSATSKCYHSNRLWTWKKQQG